MASSPVFKVYDRDGNYQAACKQLEAAGCLMTLYGDGATIRLGHRRIVWTEGTDGRAANSYDAPARKLYIGT